LKSLSLAQNLMALCFHSDNLWFQFSGAFQQDSILVAKLRDFSGHGFDVRHVGRHDEQLEGTLAWPSDKLLSV
jgi:hypothetical protein